MIGMKDPMHKSVHSEPDESYIPVQLKLFTTTTDAVLKIHHRSQDREASSTTLYEPSAQKVVKRD